MSISFISMKNQCSSLRKKPYFIRAGSKVAAVMEDEIWRARAHFLCREKLYQAMAETVKGNEAPGTAVDSSRRSQTERKHPTD